MTNQNKECPQPSVLLSFLQGKLHPPQLEQCESHLKNCQLCHETIVGLSGDDTLSERIAAAIEGDPDASFEQQPSASNTDSVEINSLLNRLTSDEFKRNAMQSPGYSVINAGLANSEIIADRAAEVLRCVTPDENSLGELGDYTLQRLIGAGSTGVVFQALDQKLDRTVALKVLRPSLGETARERFLVEAKLAASIEHVNVVTIFQVGQVGRLAYIAMPWLPGQTLESLLAVGERLEKGRIVEIIKQAAAGLQAAHKRQLVHRDIKPANLWICEEDNQLKILDFGLARISDDDPNLTATGMLAGTPNFMSPEQTRGMELDGRSDLFSLGCVLYRLLTGKLPFGAPTVLATLTSIQNDHPIPPNGLGSNMDKDLSDLTMSLLEKQPANRPQTANQTIELLSSPREQWPISVNGYSDAPKAITGAQNHRSEQLSSPVESRAWGSWFKTAIVATVLGTFAWLVAPQIIRVATDSGEVVIETDDKDVEVQVLQGGEVIRVIDTMTQQSFDLKSGEYTFNAVASKEAQDPKASFDIKPETLTMRRGEKVIVKVATSENRVANSQPASGDTGSPEKPYFRGKSFAEWFQIAKLDRDPVTQTSAIKACAATSETDDELEEILRHAQVIARRYGNITNGVDTTSDLYQSAAQEVLNRCNIDRVLQFYKTEITEGNLESREFCQRYLFLLTTGHPNRKRKEAVKNRILELKEVIASNLQSPGVIELFKELIPEGDGAEEILKKLRSSKVSAGVKELIISGNFKSRMLLLGTAINLLSDDEEVFQIYRKHLLDPGIPVDELPKNMFTTAPRLRTQLFTGLTEMLFSEDDSNGGLANDSEVSQRRTKLGAELILAVTDGLMAKNGDRLEFRGLLRRSRIGGLKGGGVSKGQIQNGFAEDLLPVFYEVSKRLKDKELRQKLAKKIQLYKKWLGEELRSSDRETFGKVFQNIDYLIGYISDDFLDPEPTPDRKLKWIAGYWEGGFNDNMVKISVSFKTGQ